MEKYNSIQYQHVTNHIAKSVADLVHSRRTSREYQPLVLPLLRHHFKNWAQHTPVQFLHKKFLQKMFC